MKNTFNSITKLTDDFKIIKKLINIRKLNLISI